MNKNCPYQKCRKEIDFKNYWISDNYDGSKTAWCSERCMLHHIKHYEEDYK